MQEKKYHIIVVIGLIITIIGFITKKFLFLLLLFPFGFNLFKSQNKEEDN